MDNSLFMRGPERIGHLDREFHESVDRNRLSVDFMLQGVALQKLHNKEGLAIVRGDLVNRADVGVIERGSRAGFALKTFQRLRSFCESFGKKFYGNVPAE